MFRLSGPTGARKCARERYAFAAGDERAYASPTPANQDRPAQDWSARIGEHLHNREGSTR